MIFRLTGFSTARRIESRSDCDNIPPPAKSDGLRATTCGLHGYHRANVFKLHPIKNVELPEVGADGDVSWWGLYALYEIALNDDWRTREGGILRAVAEYDDFFSCMLSYNSSSPKWAGVVKWDTLFEKLHNSGYRKNIIPCMVRVLRSITNITGYNCCHSFLARRMVAWIETARSSTIASPFSLIATGFSRHADRHLIINTGQPIVSN